MLDDEDPIANFDEDYEDIIPSYEDLSEEEILARQREFASLSKEGKEMLKEISGIQNTRYIHLYDLIKNSLIVIQEAEDNIEDIEFSEEYLKFMTWYTSEFETGQFYNKYEKEEKIFEDIINEGLESEDENNIMAYFTKLYAEKVNGKVKGLDSPLSSLEVEACRRFELISTTDKNLVEIFLNMNNYEGKTWKEFEEVIEVK